MAKKYIDADLLRKEINEQMKSVPREVGRGAGTITSSGYGMMQAFQIIRSIIDSLQQEPLIGIHDIGLEGEKGADGSLVLQEMERFFKKSAKGETQEQPSEDLEEAAQHSEMLTYPMPEDGDIEKVMKVQEARIFHDIGFKAGAE